MFSDAQLYSQHRSMQIRDTKPFLSSTVKKMDWTRQEEEVVMDLGCGSGNSCREMLLPTFPNIQKLIAVDVLPDMIEFAKKNNACDKIEYDVANIEDRSTLKKWEGQISKLISIYCFNWLDNQEEAFKKNYHLLKPGGQAALLFILSTPFWDSYKLHFDNPKWKEYFKDANPRIPESHFKKLNALYYRDLVDKIGLKIITCEEENRIHTFSDDESSRISVFSRSGLSSYVPDDLKDDFKEDLFHGFLKYNGRNRDGKPMLHYTTLTLVLKKANM